MQTKQELLHDLNRSTVFSKIDLKWGFHQILFREDSWHITTFVTHRGLYRYKWLMFGLTFALEKYQQIVRDVLRGCSGVPNIADDLHLIIHGKGIEEHDRCLSAVLVRLSEVGLTVNREKCEFRLSKLTFFGHELTSNGVVKRRLLPLEMQGLLTTQVRYDPLWVWFSIQQSSCIRNQAQSRVGQKGHYFQVG